MANELVPFYPRTAPAELSDDGEWDLPPIDDGAGRRIPFQSSNRGTARRDGQPSGDAASDARSATDDAFAVLRETDAAEQRQHGWGTGDARTWTWIAAMCAVFLLLVALVYYLPFGTHNQKDGGNSGGSPTPTIRVY